MTGKIDFNCDMGESFGAYTLGYDDEVVRYITSANVACGFHAGDPMWMRHTVLLAEEHGVAVGAHPSFPDLQGFGRRDMTVSPEEARNDVVYQIGALAAFTRDKRLQHVKPHGSMYNMAAGGGELARAICQAVLEVDPEMILVVLAGSPWVEVAREMGVRVAREAFADRALNPDGTTDWTYSMPPGVFGGPSIAADGTIYAGDQNGKFVAVDANGVEQWVFNEGTGYFGASAIGSDGTIYVAAINAIFANSLSSVISSGPSRSTSSAAAVATAVRIQRASGRVKPMIAQPMVVREAST